MPSRQTSRLCRTAFWSVLLLGIALRVLGAWWYRNDPMSDYAIVVEMVRDMAAFRGWPVFYYGQAYMGSLEPSVSALFALLLGPTNFAVCLGTAFFGVLLLLAAYRWASRAGGPWAGIAAMALLAIGPPGYFQYMASPRGGYALGLLLILLVLEAGCRLVERPLPSDGPAPRRILVLGLYAGLAFWNFWLVVPAIAATGVMLLLTYRQRLFRPRVLLPGIVGFFAGSLPFWVWNAAHGWASFASSNSGSPGLSGIPFALRSFFRDRLPNLLDPGFLGPRGGLLAMVLVFAATVAAAILLLRRRRERPAILPLLAAMLLFTGFFGLAYACSSFGQMNTPRYLLPFVPLFAVLAGAAIGALPARRPVAALSGLCLAAAIAFYAASIPSHLARLRRGDAFVASASDTMRKLSDAGIDGVMASYLKRAFQWAGNGTPPVTCPNLERHRGVGIAVERAENIAVLDNLRGVDHFLAATGGSAKYGSIGSRRVHRGFRAPSPVRDLPASTIRAILDDRGHDLTDLLLNRTPVCDVRLRILTGEPRHIDILLAEPAEVSGVRLLVNEGHTYGWMAVDARADESGPFAEIAPYHVDSGYFWSGPRPYWGGALARTEERFPARRVSALRLRFIAGRHDLLAMLGGIRLLAPSDAPAPDPAAITERLLAMGARRVHADRWMGEQLRPLLPENVAVSREPLIYGEDAANQEILPADGTVLVVEPDVLESTRAELARLHAHVDEIPVSGAVLIAFREPASDGGRVLGQTPLRFTGLGLLHTPPPALHSVPPSESTPPPAQSSVPPSESAPPPAQSSVLPSRATYFHTRLRVVSSSRDGSDLVLRWTAAPAFVPPHGTYAFLHFLDENGRIAAQSIAPLVLETIGPDPNGAPLLESRIPLPDNLPSGLSPVFGLFRPGLLSRRQTPDTDLPTTRKRIRLPESLALP